LSLLLVSLGNLIFSFSFLWW